MKKKDSQFDPRSIEQQLAALLAVAKSLKTRLVLNKTCSRLEESKCNCRDCQTIHSFTETLKAIGNYD